MSTLLLVAGVICLSGGVVLAFRSPSSGVTFSYLGIVALWDSRFLAIPARSLLFWALAVLIVLFINFWQRQRLAVPDVCRNYIVGGALAGMAAGLVLGYAAMVLGSAAGAVLGCVAWRRTPSGQACRLKLWQPVAEIGLPAVVTMSMAGLALLGVMMR